jgi:hypothetical protein
MSFRLRFILAVILPASLATLCAAQTTSLITNDDGVLHSYVSFFTAGGSSGAPTLTFASDVNTQGQGIGGGYFAASRLAMLPDASAQCIYASNAGSGNISGINLQTKQLTGLFSGSEGDAGDQFGIGMVQNTNYLYAGYTASNTIATFSVLPGCQLSFLGDTPAAGLNGGSPAGMALHGNMLVVAYADGSIESFNVSDGLPVSNDDAQNSTAYLNAGSNFPEGVDITQDGHYAIFGDSSIATTIEVSDISSGKLTQTIQYTVSGERTSAAGPPVSAVGSGVNSGALRLSPDESMIFIGNSDGGSVTAAFFNKNTGRISGGCKSPTLAGFYNPWAFVGSVATRDTTGTGGVLYVADYGFVGSYIGVLKITSTGLTCTLTESSGSEVPDLLTDGLLSITVFPPRTF